LVTLLSRKNIKFYDTSRDGRPTNIIPEQGLVGIKIESNPKKPTVVTFEPPLGTLPERFMKGKLSFNTWWNHEVINDKEGNTFTRRQLVLAVCNKEGGAHIAEKITKKICRFNYEKFYPTS
jgi:hypothetical protein